MARGRFEDGGASEVIAPTPSHVGPSAVTCENVEFQETVKVAAIFLFFKYDRMKRSNICKGASAFMQVDGATAAPVLDCCAAATQDGRAHGLHKLTRSANTR